MGVDAGDAGVRLIGSLGQVVELKSDWGAMAQNGSSFQRLKNRANRMEIRRFLSAVDVSDSKGQKRARKVQTALVAGGAIGLARKIDGCQRGALCQSNYCKFCRDRYALKMLGRLKHHFENVLHRDAEELQERGRYLTVLTALVPFEKRAALKALDDGKSVLHLFHRSFPEVWIQGTWEFELIDCDDVMAFGNFKATKPETLLALLDGDASAYVGRRLLVHFHAFVDVGNTDAQKIRHWWKKRFSKHHRQVELKSTREGQDVEKKLFKMASYGFKDRLAYNPSFVTSGWEDGRSFANKDACKLIRLYQEVGVKRLIISIGNS